MARFPRALPPMSGGSDAAQVQHSLFTNTDIGEQPAMTSTQPEIRSTSRAKKNTGYSAADIQVLEGISAIRHRPGMYIGST